MVQDNFGAIIYPKNMIGNYKFKMIFALSDVASITLPESNKTFFKLTLKDK